MNRRSFFRLSAAGSGSLMLSMYLVPGCAPVLASEDTPDWEPNFYLRISPNNELSFICTQSEIGQGTSTGLAMILADELGADLNALKTEFAVGSEERFGELQDTGGSNGIRLLWMPLREAAAAARMVLCQAAANRWGISADACRTDQGLVWELEGERTLSFGELVAEARSLAAPREVCLRDPAEFRYIGKGRSGTKNQAIVRGETDYSINKRMPGMVYAAIARCPYWLGSLKHYDAREALALTGVIDVIEMKGSKEESLDYLGGLRPGVAIIAKDTWTAFEAKKRLIIEWEPGPNGARGSQDLIQELERSKQKVKLNHNYLGGAERFKQGVHTWKASYLSPLQANACMEPLNATAFHQGQKITVWAGTQSPQLTRKRIAELMDLPEAAVIVHNPPAGGGFGRRYACDFVEEAVILSEQVRKPVKLIWSREDTLQTSKYHPLRTEHWEAALDVDKKPIALSNYGILRAPNGYISYPYGLPLQLHETLSYEEGMLVPRASWRSVYAHPFALGLESFIDELAHQVGIDPLEYRRELLTRAAALPPDELPIQGVNYDPKRLLACLDKVAEASQWHQKENLGCSVYLYNYSYCAQVAEVEVVAGKIRVKKVYAAIDCGLAVNPSQVKAQVEGSINWGLGAVLNPGIHVEQGRVGQSNFDDYDLLRMSQAPEIEVFVINGADAPTGAGEPAVPGIAPALLNAVFAATGQRFRDLPIPADSLG